MASSTFSSARRRPSPLVGAAVLGGGFALLFLVAFLLIIAQTGGSGPAGRLVSPGDTAPDFSLAAHDGRTFHLADYKGRAVFVAFVPDVQNVESRNQLRSLAQTVSKFDAAGGKILVVSPEPASALQTVHAREKLPFPLLSDAGGKIAARYHMTNRRATFVVEPSGKVKFLVTLPAEQTGPRLLDVSKCCLDEVTAARAQGVNKPMGDFSLPRADNGKMETIRGDGTQKATVVLFVSVKCPCSNAYNDRIRDLGRQAEKENVRVVGVFSNHDETTAQIADFARLHGWNFPVLQDERGLCADHFKASLTPEAFVLDNKNILRYQGRMDDNRDLADVKTRDVADAIAALVQGNTPPVQETRAFGCAIERLDK